VSQLRLALEALEREEIDAASTHSLAAESLLREGDTLSDQDRHALRELHSRCSALADVLFARLAREVAQSARSRQAGEAYDRTP
jgi:hypothetical protein